GHSGQHLPRTPPKRADPVAQTSNRAPPSFRFKPPANLAVGAGQLGCRSSLGGVPQESRTDSLSAAYRNLDKDATRDVTERYEAFCRHYGMVASRNNPGEAHENGAIEAHNNHLKVALDQALILRGSRDFPDIDAWRRFVDEVVARRNRRREDKIKVELQHLKPLPTQRTTDFTELVVRVVRTGGFLVHSVFYSVPSQFIGQRLRVHVYDDRIEAYLGATHVVSHPRMRGRKDGKRIHSINYRHVIHVGASGVRDVQALLNLIKFLANELEMPVIAFGTDASLHVLKLDTQVDSRFDKHGLRVWRDNEAFADLVCSIVAAMPLRAPSPVQDRAVMRALVALSGGITGDVFHLLTTAAAAAVGGEERITLQGLEAAAAGEWQALA
ncbi:TniB family NTP-binding protein, partial [Ruegeria sp.]|uniref:TniB family NTP-binding protein n=1 Tax=Ruegeria sp. TaxID=1879320 RepID=UPI003B5CA727